MTSRQRGARTRAARFAAGLLLLGGAIGLATVSAEAVPPGPDGGALTVLPASGGTEAVGDVRFTAPAACPAPADVENFGSVIVLGSGAGFPEAPNDVLVSANAIAVDEAQTAELGRTWNDLAQAKGMTLPLTGLMTVRLQCLDLDLGTSHQDFTAQIQFTPTTGDNSTYAVVGAGSPTPAATPTPAPTGEATPTPTPTGEATPTPEPDDSDPTPTPEPECAEGEECPATDEDDGSGGDDGTGGTDSSSGGELPGAGAGTAVPMAQLAAMILLVGAAVLMFEAASRPAHRRPSAEDGWL